MKKRYLLLLPVALCVIACAAAVGYIHFNPSQAPAGTPSVLLREPDAPSAQTDAGSGQQPEELTAAQQRARELLDGMTLGQ